MCIFKGHVFLETFDAAEYYPMSLNPARPGSVVVSCYFCKITSYGFIVLTSATTDKLYQRGNLIYVF